MTNIADRIKTYRAINGLSQGAFARRCGVSKSTISHIETEPDRPIGAMTMRKIEYVLMGGKVKKVDLPKQVTDTIDSYMKGE
jgi:DNA-binding XRE family transcriptional regulator